MKKYLLLCVPLLILFFSCKQVPIETIEWVNDGQGYLQYSTNDEAKCNYSMLHNCSGSYEMPMATLEVRVKKVSGAIAGPFGCIFCREDWDNFYRVLISVEGWYKISKKVDGTYSTIIDWTATGNILQGLGQVNVIRITQSGSSYSVYINDLVTAVTVFGDTDLDNGGESGFCAVVLAEDDEDFPDVPVDVRFKMISPVAVP
jgi:hypothetical protein